MILCQFSESFLKSQMSDVFNQVLFFLIYGSDLIFSFIFFISQIPLIFKKNYSVCISKLSLT